MYSPTLKRAVDLIGTATGLVLFSVPMLLISGCIRASMGSPILFRQRRPGLGGKPFVMYKFRTMENEDLRDEVLQRKDEAAAGTRPDEERITRLGSFLRRSSLDELPGLLNVLKGEMSLVGPRPLLVEYLDLYTPRQARRHELKPGITGWSQVMGRNNLSWEDRFNLDVWYVENASLRLDLKILWLTVVKVLRREGVNAPGHATMPRFEGSPQENR